MPSLNELPDFNPTRVVGGVPIDDVRAATLKDLYRAMSLEESRVKGVNQPKNSK